MKCTGDYGTCPRDSKRAGLCWAHLKRKQRNLSINEPIRDRPENPEDALIRAAVALDEDDAEERLKAQDRLRKAAVAGFRESVDPRAWKALLQAAEELSRVNSEDDVAFNRAMKKLIRCRDEYGKALAARLLGGRGTSPQTG